MTAKAYFEQSELWGRQPEPYQVQVLADILDLLPGDVTSVLDVGCGDGVITNALPPHLKVVGLDPSPAALRHVRRETRIGSISAIPFKDDAFDLVMTTDVIEHLPPDVLKLAVKELTRVAKKYVLVCVPHQEDWKSHFTRCAACGNTYHINHHQRSWSEPDLVRGLFPAPWAVQEVRYSGLFRPYHDPTIDLRHRVGLWHTWDGAVCPNCDAKEQFQSTAQHGRVKQLIDSLCASLWWSETAPKFYFHDRSEIMALYSSGSRPPRLYAPTEPTVTHDHFHSIDFRNALQRIEGWTIDPRWPCFENSAEHIRCAQGIRLIRREYFAYEVAMRFPVQPVAGDELILDLTAEADDVTITLFAIDALNQRRVRTEVVKVGRGRERARFTMDDALRQCCVDRYGFMLIASIFGTAVVHRADYLPAGRMRDDAPWLHLEPGHQVLSQRTADYVRSWGFTSLEGGRLPLPVDLAEPDVAPETAVLPALPDLATSLQQQVGRVSRKHADSLLFQLEQEMNELYREPLPAAARDPGYAIGAEDIRRRINSYHTVINHGGKRVLVLSHLYPSREMPNLGPFVHEQVSALRVSAGIDARVVCCTPFWFNSRHPLTIARAYRVYRRLFETLKWETYDGVPVLYLPYIVGGYFQPWLHGTTYARSVMHASDWLRATFPFELIHAHTSFLDGSAAHALGQRYDVPYLITEHTGPFRLLTDHWYKRRLTARALGNAREVFCVSGALAQNVREFLPPALHAKVRVLHNGVDTALFYPPIHWTPSADRPRILSVMSLDENKNPLLLLEAFKRLHK
jgi:SAM-dependent methyltransferase